MTCGGCESDDFDEPEYYCARSNGYIYFRCEVENTDLTWRIAPLGISSTLGSLNEPENIIRHDYISIFLDSVVTTSNSIKVISFLWIELASVDIESDLIVSCSNGTMSYNKTLRSVGGNYVPMQYF